MWCETLIIKKVIFKSVIKSLQSLCLLLNCICVPTFNKYYLIITVRQYDPAIHREDYRYCGLSLLQPCTDHSLSVALWLRRRLGLQWWFVYPDKFVPSGYFRINGFSKLLNRQLVGTWKSVPTVFVRTSEISGLSEPGLTNHHCIWRALSKPSQRQ